MTFHDISMTPKKMEKSDLQNLCLSMFVSCFLKHLDSERQLSSKFHSIPVKVPREHHLQEAGHSPGPPGMAQWGRRVEGCAQVVFTTCSHKETFGVPGLPGVAV